MRQQKYEQALKDIQKVLADCLLKRYVNDGVQEALTIANKALHRPAASDMTDEERGASIARDEANNHSGY